MSRAHKVLNRLAHLTRMRMFWQERRLAMQAIRNSTADHANVTDNCTGLEPLEQRVLLSDTPFIDGIDHHHDHILDSIDPHDSPPAVVATLEIEDQSISTLLAAEDVEINGIPTWVSEGPIAIENSGSLIPNQNSPSTGAINAIAAHPNGRHVWIGGVNGGVWRTDDIRRLDGGQPSPIWTPQTDHFQSLSIASIAISPRDSNGDPLTANTFANDTVLYAGTGSFSSAGRIRNSAKGLLVSRNGGLTWDAIGVNFFDGLRITSVVPTANPGVLGSDIVLVSALDQIDASTGRVTRQGGVFRGVIGERNGRPTEQWTRVSGTGNLPVGQASDLIGDPSNQNRFYAGVIGSGVFISTDGGTMWNPVNQAGANGLTTAPQASRIEFALHNSTGNNVLTVGLVGAQATLSNPLALPAAPGSMRATTVQVSSVAGFQMNQAARVNSRQLQTTLTAPVPGGNMVSQITVADSSIFGPAGSGRVSRLALLDGNNTEFFNVASVPNPTTVVLGSTITNPHSDGVVVIQTNQTVRIAAVTPMDPNFGGAPSLTLDFDDTTNSTAGNQPLTSDFPAGTTIEILGQTDRQQQILSRGQLQGLFQSSDQGMNWTAMPTPTTTDNMGRVNGIHPGGQGNTMFSIVADPGNPNRVFVGGDRQPRGSGGNVASCSNFFGTVWSVTGGGSPGTQELVCNHTNGTAPHPDSRIMVVLPPLPGDPANAPLKILEGSDGGIFMLDDPNNASANQRNWRSLIGNLSLSEVFSISYDPLNNRAFIGNQDTGSATQSASGSEIWSDVVVSRNTSTGRRSFQSGDGNTQLVDTKSFPNEVLRYQMANSFRSLFLRRFNSSNQIQDLVMPPMGQSEPTNTNILAERVRLASPVAAAFVGDPASSATVINPARDLGLVSGLGPSDRGIGFIAGLPVAVNTVDPTRLLVANQGLYEGFNPVTKQGTRGNRVWVVQNEMLPPVRALIYGGKRNGVENPDVIYAARGDSVFVRTTPPPMAGAHPNLPRRRIPGARQIRDLVVDPEDFHTVYAADENNIWISTDQGMNWNRLTGNLNGRGLNFQSIELVKTDDATVLLLGGLGGVYRVIDPNPSDVTTLQWTLLGQGLPNVTVMDIHYDDTDNILFAGTLGRGVYSIRGAVNGTDDSIDQPSFVFVNGTNDLPGSQTPDSVRLRMDPHAPRLLQIFSNNNTDTPDVTLPAEAIGSLTVFGRPGDDTLTIDTTNGVIPINVIEYDGGENDDTLTILRSRDHSVNAFTPTLLEVDPDATFVAITGDGQVRAVGRKAVETFTTPIEPLIEISPVAPLGDTLKLLDGLSDSLLPGLDLPGVRTSLGPGLTGRSLPPTAINDLSRSGGKVARQSQIGGGGQRHDPADLRVRRRAA